MCSIWKYNVHFPSVIVNCTKCWKLQYSFKIGHIRYVWENISTSSLKLQSSADWEELLSSKLEFQNKDRIQKGKSADWSQNEEQPQIIASDNLETMDSSRNEENDHE